MHDFWYVFFYYEFFNMCFWRNKLAFAFIFREILTSTLKTLNKRFKIETLSWNLCIEHIKKSKSNLLYIKIINCYYFLNF